LLNGLVYPGFKESPIEDPPQKRETSEIVSPEIPGFAYNVKFKIAYDFISVNT
jgi:hypothetical protein